MQRRRAIQTILGTPAALAVPRRARAETPQQGPPGSTDTTKLALTAPDAAADSKTKYFTPAQLATLKKLGDLLVPGGTGRPSASEARAAEFLDFLISQSPMDRQSLYSNGLDRLQLEAGRRFNRRFADLTAEQADALLGPLHQAWTYQAPPDSFARFLRAAKEDFIAATINSREFAAAQTAAGRRAPGMGTYWYPIE